MGLTFRLGQIPLGVFTDASNNVGIGAAPSGTYKLEVTGTGRFTGALTGTSATFSGDVSINKSASTLSLASTGTYSVLAFTNTGTGGNIVVNNTPLMDIQCNTIKFTDSTGANQKLILSSTGAATFSSSVTAGGNIINGSSANGLTFATYNHVITSTSLTDTRGIGFYANDGTQNPRAWIKHVTASGSQYLEFNSDWSSATTFANFAFLNGKIGIGTTSFTYQLQLSTDSAAKPTSSLWTIASDKRIKENINPYKKGLQELLKINPIIYDYNGLGGFIKGKGGVGIIAQEIIDILPDSVSSIKAKLNETDEDETDILNFNGHELIYVLINSIKEQQATITSLQDRLDKAGL